jgi:hypothetical protein
MFGGGNSGGSGGRGFRLASGGSGSGGGGDGSSKAGGLWNAYLRMVEAYPVLTKGATCAVLNAVGDIACQVLLEKKAELDMHRIVVFSALGAFLVGPTLHFWYSTLSKLVTATGTSGAMMRLAADQLVFAPLFNGLFMAVLLTVNGQSHLVKAKLQQDLVPTVKANWILWVPAQFVNFRYVPLHLQVLFANTVALAWNVYLSYASHKEVPVTVVTVTK